MTIEDRKTVFMFNPMRGQDTRQGVTFSYVSPERRVPIDHPLRPIRKMVGRGIERIIQVVWAAVSGLGTALDRAGEAAAGVVAATAVFDSQ